MMVKNRIGVNCIDYDLGSGTRLNLVDQSAPNVVKAWAVSRTILWAGFWPLISVEVLGLIQTQKLQLEPGNRRQIKL